MEAEAGFDLSTRRVLGLLPLAATQPLFFCGPSRTYPVSDGREPLAGNLPNPDRRGTQRGRRESPPLFRVRVADRERSASRTR
jgi:hypothetical protein